MNDEAGQHARSDNYLDDAASVALVPVGGDRQDRCALVGMPVHSPCFPAGAHLLLLRPRVPAGIRRRGSGMSEMPNERYFEQLAHAEPEPRAYGVGSFSMGLDRVYRVIGECFPAILASRSPASRPRRRSSSRTSRTPSRSTSRAPEFHEDDADRLPRRRRGNKVYRSDKFTPKSFVSHSASVSREKLQEVDLLPRIRHRVLLVPELAPLFGLRNEDLLENFSILTRVLDGQGLSTDSGVHGRRGHTGDYLFAWIGCTTPIEYRVWKTMGKLGSRFLFFEMPAKEHSDAELVTTSPAVLPTRSASSLP